jgi:hypothetical protein
MKKIILILGIIISLIGIYQSGRYFLDYSTLSQYGKGYVWGSIILFLIGVVLIYLGLKKKKTSP